MNRDHFEMFKGCPILDNHHQLFQIAYVTSNSKGAVYEFGVFTGGTTKIIRDLFGPGVVGFDSFKGLPEDWKKTDKVHAKKGCFSLEDWQIPQIDGVDFVTGFYEDTVPGYFKSTHKGPIRFAHIDCDLYSSTVTVLDAIKPHLVDGSILVFDELAKFETSNYENFREGEWKALHESGISFLPLARTGHEQAAIRVCQ